MTAPTATGEGPADPRTTPANARVAAAHLRGRVAAARYSQGAPHRIAPPVADLLRTPGGPRDRQLLMGEAVTCFDVHDGWAFVQAARDGYVGYVPVASLTEGPAPTHRVTVRATHLYPAADFKARETAGLSHGSLLHVTGRNGAFAETAQGHVPATHLTAAETCAVDPVAVAALFLGTPYLWGGNSAFGIDCSGLVQAGCLACGIPCPGDSDLQEAALGTPLPADAPPARGDLIFWRGHVAWVADAQTLLHANVFHMAVVTEPLQDAVKRIERQGGGPVTARKRLGG